MDVIVGALVGFLAFDAGVYASSYRGKLGDVERVVEPVALVVTAVGLAAALLFSGRMAAAAVLVCLAGRALFDTLHLGDGNVLVIPLPRDFALYSMVVKVAVAVLFVFFAFPA